MYCVMNFHVFVCSACAGIHREMTHKVKGISMCVFNDQELKDLSENGNAVSLQSVMSHHRELEEELSTLERLSNLTQCYR